MPVMVEDYINGSFCHSYIGVNGEAARLPERDKGYIFRFRCTLSLLSLHSKHARSLSHSRTGTHTSIRARAHLPHTHNQSTNGKKDLNICCLFELNCSFAKVSSDVHFVIVKSTSVATSFEVECGSFVQGQTHT